MLAKIIVYKKQSLKS